MRPRLRRQHANGNDERHEAVVRDNLRSSQEPGRPKLDGLRHAFWKHGVDLFRYPNHVRCLMTCRSRQREVDKYSVKMHSYSAAFKSIKRESRIMRKLPQHAVRHKSSLILKLHVKTRPLTAWKRSVVGDHYEKTGKKRTDFKEAGNEIQTSFFRISNHTKSSQKK